MHKFFSLPDHEQIAHHDSLRDGRSDLVTLLVETEFGREWLPPDMSHINAHFPRFVAEMRGSVLHWADDPNHPNRHVVKDGYIIVCADDAGAARILAHPEWEPRTTRLAIKDGKVRAV